MTTAIQTTLFDYDALDAETRIVVQQRTTEIKALMKRAASDIIEIGRKLIEVKARLGHDNWTPWLETELGCSPDTAQRMMRVARVFGEKPQIAVFDPSALYLLAAPSTPESARVEAIARAEEGETITHGLARGIIHDHKAPALPFEPEERDDPLWWDRDGEPVDERQQRTIVDVQTGEIFDRQEAIRNQRMGVTVYSSESNEWYTPAWVTARAAAVMGNIDLDPASSQTAQMIHKADEWYGLDHPDPDRRDGLTPEWYGCVWLNPPYGRSEDGHNAQLWSRKLINEWKAGRVNAGVLLVKAALGYNWFEELWRELPVCFLRERLSFVRPDGTDDGQSKQATALFYVGSKSDQFVEVFSQYGRVILPDSEDI